MKAKVAIVLFNASIHVTNHYMADYATFSRWQNFTNTNDWMTTTFYGVNDCNTLFVCAYEYNSPVFNVMERGR